MRKVRYDRTVLSIAAIEERTKTAIFIVDNVPL